MLGLVLLYSGSIIVLIWGAAHLFPTRTIVRGFGSISEDNRKIITMEWMAEGVAMIYMGILAVLVTAIAGRAGTASTVVYLSTAITLIVMAILGWLTYARTPIIPMKLCPWIQTLSALLLLAGTVY
ncbi:MAG: hypothetical protein NTY79_03805 [Chloroflexi bacterium]|nr:hypothetical protein [Chloroflexota bacterium]